MVIPSGSTPTGPDGALIGAVVGGVVGFVFLMLVVVMCIVLRKRRGVRPVDRDPGAPQVVHDGPPEHIYEDVDAVIRPREVHIYDDVHSALQ